jgi:hypothetical protein
MEKNTSNLLQFRIAEIKQQNFKVFKELVLVGKTAFSYN